MLQARRPSSLVLLSVLSSLSLLWSSVSPASGARRAHASVERKTLPPAELVELRTEFDSVFLNGSGELRTEGNSTARHYRGEDGRWLPIQPRLLVQADGSLLDEANSLTSHFPPRADGETMLWRKADGASLLVRPAGLSLRHADGSIEQLAAPWAWSDARMSEERSVTYPEIYPGLSERYRVEAGRVRHELVLSGPLPDVMAREGDVLLVSWDVVSEGMVDDGGFGLRPAPGARGHREAGALTEQRRLIAGSNSRRVTTELWPRASELEEATHPTVIDVLASYLAAGSGASGSTGTAPDCESEELFAADGGFGNQMGFSVSLEGDTALVGSPRDSELAASAGAVHVFLRDGELWTESAKLTASDAVSGDAFGWSVSLSQDTLFVGAPGRDDAGASSGAVYVFERSGLDWEEVQKLGSADGAIGDVFGRSVSVSEGLALVSADGDDDAGTRSGSAYVFRKDAGDWVQEAKLIASDISTGDRFGFSLSLDGETAIIGAPSHRVGGVVMGAAYIFSRDGGWTEDAALTPTAGVHGELFGSSVAISGSRAVVGAPRHLAAGLLSGAATVYAWTGASWDEEAQLLPMTAAANDEFGHAVAISGDRILVGASLADDLAPDAGAAVLFLHDGSSWSEEARLSDLDAEAGDKFGIAVALSDDTTLVGVSGTDDDGLNAGSASVRSCSLE